MNDKDREIEILIRARYPIIYLVSWEERRLEDVVFSIARARRKVLYVWSITDGLVSQGIEGRFPENLKEPLKILDMIKNSKESAIFILKDFHPFMEDPWVIRKLKDVAAAIKSSHNTLLIMSSELKIPRELEKDITILDYPLPSYQELKALLDSLIDSLKNNNKVIIEVNPDVEEKLIKAALGLTMKEAENVFARAVVIDNKLSESDIDVILLEKEQIIRKTGILEYYHAQEKFSQVGGLKHLKDWLMKRGVAFTEKAREFGLPQPKGILLLGVQGCGKSLCAKVVSSLWNLPLLRLDMGNIFAGVVGSSEGNVRKAIKMAESLSPCILWIDEIEKGLSGSQSSGMSDGGTTARVFGTLLSWMQEKTSPVFVISTANDISQLPPELLRKGRFDEIFFVDLPTGNERKQIFKIHLSKRKRNSENFDIQQLAQKSEGFSGAEIEQAIIEGMFNAFSASRELSTEDIANALMETFPLSKTMAEKIQGLRAWAANRARKASV
ncbi:MAG: AAA family ATPase [Vulcanimicrobiota bacterium]